MTITGIHNTTLNFNVDKSNLSLGMHNVNCKDECRYASVKTCILLSFSLSLFIVLFLQHWEQLLPFIIEENQLEQFLYNNSNPLEQNTYEVLSASFTHYISSKNTLISSI